MGKDTEANAQDQIIKADQLFKARLFKKAGKTYHSAGNNFLKLNKYDVAKKCFLNAMSSFIELERFDTAIELLRQAGETCLQNNSYSEAFSLYKEALEYIPRLKSQNDRNQYYILFSALSYLCLHAKGSPEEGLDYIKRNRSKIENAVFKESDLIQLISEITITLRDKTEKYLDKIHDNIGQFKLRNPELSLLKTILFLVKAQIILKSTLTLDKAVYTTNDNINLSLKINLSLLNELRKNPLYEIEVNSLYITKLNVNLSDNLTANLKPQLPQLVELNSPLDLVFILKPHFQLDNPKIGPISITFEINNLLVFNYETEVIIPNITSPPASLLVSIKNLRPPLLDQTFPLEILVENRSQGEALDVNLRLEFPEELKLMRGTTDKQIYSLRINETLKWEVNLKPLEIGDYIIKMFMKFKDSDDNLIEETKEFPFSIKM